jgi:hypothetical protein
MKPVEFFVAVRQALDGETVFLYEARPSKVGARKAAKNTDKISPQKGIDTPVIRVSKFRASEVDEC